MLRWLNVKLKFRKVKLLHKMKLRKKLGWIENDKILLVNMFNDLFYDENRIKITVLQMKIK